MNTRRRSSSFFMGCFKKCFNPHYSSNSSPTDQQTATSSEVVLVPTSSNPNTLPQIEHNIEKVIYLIHLSEPRSCAFRLSSLRPLGLRLYSKTVDYIVSICKSFRLKFNPIFYIFSFLLTKK